MTLTLPGTLPGLLRRCSPVVFRVGGCTGVVTHFAEHKGTPDVPHVWWDADELTKPSHPSSIGLSLECATGRAHAAWWVGGRMGLPPGLAPLARLEHDGEAWCVTVDGSRWAWGAWGDEFQTHVRGLTDLDPNDPRALADGSRWVDAEALRLVCLHVGGVE